MNATSHTRSSIFAFVIVFMSWHCNAAHVKKEANKSPNDAMGNKLCALELKNELKKLEFVTFVNDDKDKKINKLTHPLDWNQRDQREYDPNWIFQLSPNRFIVRKQMVPEKTLAEASFATILYKSL